MLKRALLLTTLLVLMASARPPRAHAQAAGDVATGLFTEQIAAFERDLRGMMGSGKVLARDLLLLLIAIELAVSGAMWGLGRVGADELVYRLAIKCGIFALILKVIEDTGTASGIFNLEHIPNGFRALAVRLTGMSPPYPGDVLAMGFEVSADISRIAFLKMWITPPLLSTLVSVSVVIVTASFVVIGIRHFIALIHAVLVPAVGIILLGFAGFRGTASLADRYIMWMFNVAIKLFLLDVLIAIVNARLPAVFAELIAGWEGFFQVFMFPAFALAYVGLVLYVPNMAARLLTENLSVNISRYVNL